MVLRVEGHARPQFFFPTFDVCVIAASLTAGSVTNRIGLSATASIGLIQGAASVIVVALAAHELPLVIAGGVFSAVALVPVLQGSPRSPPKPCGRRSAAGQKQR